MNPKGMFLPLKLGCGGIKINNRVEVWALGRRFDPIDVVGLPATFVAEGNVTKICR